MLRAVALISAVYDVSIGIVLLGFRDALQASFGVPAPLPPIHADLNAIFAITIGIGYLLPYWDPFRYRAYLWLMGPVLKGAGAAAFVADVLLRGSPPAFLLFAACDAALAGVTLWALLRGRR